MYAKLALVDVLSNALKGAKRLASMLAVTTNACVVVLGILKVSKRVRRGGGGGGSGRAVNEGVRQRHELSGYNCPLIDTAVDPLSLSSTQ